MKYNEILKSLREDRDMTQTELAKIFNLTQRQISNYEVGRNEPAYDILIKYAKYFNVSIDYILGIKNDERKTYNIKNQNIINGGNNINIKNK